MLLFHSSALVKNSWTPHNSNRHELFNFCFPTRTAEGFEIHFFWLKQRLPLVTAPRGFMALFCTAPEAVCYRNLLWKLCCSSPKVSAIPWWSYLCHSYNADFNGLRLVQHFKQTTHTAKFSLCCRAGSAATSRISMNSWINLAKTTALPCNSRVSFGK